MTVWMLPSSGEVANNIEDLYHPNLAPFYHGVASGDPLPDGVILWTRVTRKQNDDDRILVEWTVAMDPGLADIVASGDAFATEERDFTVKIDVRGLDPGQTYYYGFKALGRTSVTGKTKTVPNAAVDQLKFADLDRHGYVVLSVAADQVQADYYYLKNILRRETTETWGAGFISPVGTHHQVPADAPAPPKAELDTPAP